MSVYVVKLPALRVFGQNGNHYNARFEIGWDPSKPASADLELRRGTDNDKYPLAACYDITPHELRTIATELLDVADTLIERRARRA